MTVSSRFPVFAITFGFAFAALYAAFEQMNWALVTYHPATGIIEFLTKPGRSGQGPAMHWYGWILSSAAGAAILGALAMLLPGNVSKKIWPGLVWVVPIVAIAFLAYTLRDLFMR